MGEIKNKYFRLRLDIKNENLIKGIHLEGLECWVTQMPSLKIIIVELTKFIIKMQLQVCMGEIAKYSKAIKDIFVPITIGGE